MSKYTEKALAFHEMGYNCAQAVLCAFSDRTDVDEKVLYKIAEGLGAGMGNRKNTCGALSGAVMLSGLINSSGDVENSTKADTYKLSGEIVDKFERRCGAFVCTDIKGMETGNPTASCSDCIVQAVAIAEETLFKK